MNLSVRLRRSSCGTNDIEVDKNAFRNEATSGLVQLKMCSSLHFFVLHLRVVFLLYRSQNGGRWGVFLPHRTPLCERYTLICMGMPPGALICKVANYYHTCHYVPLITSWLKKYKKLFEHSVISRHCVTT